MGNYPLTELLPLPLPSGVEQLPPVQGAVVPPWMQLLQPLLVPWMQLPPLPSDPPSAWSCVPTLSWSEAQLPREPWLLPPLWPFCQPPPWLCEDLPLLVLVLCGKPLPSSSSPHPERRVSVPHLLSPLPYLVPFSLLLLWPFSLSPLFLVERPWLCVQPLQLLSQHLLWLCVPSLLLPIAGLPPLLFVQLLLWQLCQLPTVSAALPPQPLHEPCVLPPPVPGALSPSWPSCPSLPVLSALPLLAP
mmetsp:Transcript_14615/g.41869  ORF Transcript_14615/g.41869 Transcript_14615/m.41869 type:complete len:245 (+) Transcript_14615:596-1330(+)